MGERYKSYNRFRSETFRKGEPQSHIDSAQIVCNFIDELNPPYFTNQREDFEFPDGFKHQFDIIVRKTNDDNPEASVITHFVEIGDVGDDSKHQLPHKSQLINDGVAKSHVEIYYRSAKYLKINKGDSFYRMFVLRKKLKLL